MSIEKACRLLGLELVKVPVDRQGRLDCEHLPDLDGACLVLTAGTTATGAIDPLYLVGAAKWTHVDAAWAGPLRLSQAHSARLDGIEKSDRLELWGRPQTAVNVFRPVYSSTAALVQALPPGMLSTNLRTGWTDVGAFGGGKSVCRYGSHDWENTGCAAMITHSANRNREAEPPSDPNSEA